MISQLGKYEIRRELSRGAMGIVYEAYDPLIKRRVALKTIRPDQLEGERTADMIARFRREAQAAGRLSHPNIVAIHEFDEDNGTWFIAMEFVDGRDLKDCFAADERFRMADIERIMTQILDALDYSHRQGVVHRDIKPANVFLLPDGNVKVADFGIAHIEASNLTQVGTVVGTPNYMSPEQIMGLPVDGRSDLFSAGVILYQFLTGERPFAGSSTTTMQKVLKEDPLPPSTLNVQLAPPIDAVVRKALAKRADDRFATAQEFSTALRAAMRSSAPAPVAATHSADPDATVPNLAAVAPPPPPPIVPGPATAASSLPPAPGPATVASSLPQPPARASQKPAVALVGGLAVLGIAAVAAAWWMIPREAAMPAAAAPAPASAAQGAANPASPAVANATRAVDDFAAPAAPGMLVVSAVGLADPSDPRYASDSARMQADVRADSKQQLVEKALVLMLDRKSFASHYELLRSRVLAQSGDYVTAVQEDAPRVGKDGLMSITTRAVVNVKAIQQVLDRMSRDERVDLIRAHGDPRIAVRISVRDEDPQAGPPRPSPGAENILKERIQSFGFRTWSDEATAPGAAEADFIVSGEAIVRKLSTRLAASGLTITKYALAAWTVKCTDRATGEEIYFNTALPTGTGSWASEEEALRAIGAKIADEFSRDFFLRHVPVRGRKVTLTVTGLPDAATEDLLARELIGLPGVITARAGPPAKPRSFDVQMAPGADGEAVANEIVRPLNAKLGEACFAVGASDAERVAISFDARCTDGTTRARLETNPPAALYGAPPERQKAVIKNPETLRKLMV
jgi:serine/threonine-protein kinase